MHKSDVVFLSIMLHLACAACAPTQTPAPTHKLATEQPKEDKLEEALNTLRLLLQDTHFDNPDRAALLMQLADLLWTKSTHHHKRAYQLQADPEHERLQQQIEREQQQVSLLRQEVIACYTEIIDKYPAANSVDEAYALLAMSLSAQGQKAEALAVHQKLILLHPQSQYTPNALLEFGEHYFNANLLLKAKAFYEKVLEKGTSSVSLYARYKLAWCYYNLAEPAKALQELVEVVQTGQASQGGERTLAQEALKDIVLVYAEVGKSDEAPGFFEKLAGDAAKAQSMSERLAMIWFEQGKFEKSISMHRALIVHHGGSIAAVGYQAEIVRASSALGDSTRVVEEIHRAVEMFKAVKNKPNVSPEATSQVRDELEKIVREHATMYHRESSAGAPETRQRAMEMYKLYLETFPESKQRGTLKDDLDKLNQALNPRG